MLSVPLTAQGTYYMDPKGGDSNPGTSDKPSATLVRVQEVVVVGGVIYINPGTHVVPANQVSMITTNSGFYHCAFHMNKSDEAGRPIFHLANSSRQGRPTFNLSQVKLKDQHITVSHVTGPSLYLKGLDIIDTRVTVTGYTQSKCFRTVKGANNSRSEDLRTHNGMAIGFYLLGGSDNRTLSCDAYNNYDSASEGGKGGNVDGSSGHINSSSVGESRGTGNMSEGCRAWYNSDDGFDSINCFEVVKIISCWSFSNEYRPGTKEVAGDGTGFRTGGYGMAVDKLPAIPSVIPQYKVRNSLAYYNRLRGFYADRHLGEIILESNAAVNSGGNYNMTDRESPLAFPSTGVDGYDYMVKNNLLLVTRSGSRHIVMVNKVKGEVSDSSLDGSEKVAGADFTSLGETGLMRGRKPNGDLPDVNFGKLTTDAELRSWGMGCFATGEPTDLDFDWLRKPTITVVGSRASVMGPETASFTKMYVIVDSEETTEFDKDSIDLSDFSGVLEVKIVIEGANGNITKSTALKFKR